jgi:hypothetical protein
MQVHEFFAKYANTPIKLRFVPISFKDGGDMTLNNVYDEMKQLEDKMRPMRIRQTELLKLASIVLDRKRA